MVKHTTVALLQSVIGLIAIIVNASLQTNALVQLGKTKLVDPEIKNANRLLLISVVTQFVAAVFMITSLVMLLRHRKDVQAHMNKFAYFMLFVSGALLLVGGSLGSAASLQLQCYKHDASVAEAWTMSTYSAVIGVVGALLLLIIQGFTKRDVICKELAKQVGAVMKKPSLPTQYPPRSQS